MVLNYILVGCPWPLAFSRLHRVHFTRVGTDTVCEFSYLHDISVICLAANVNQWGRLGKGSEWKLDVLNGLEKVVKKWNCASAIRTSNSTITKCLSGTTASTESIWKFDRLAKKVPLKSDRWNWNTQCWFFLVDLTKYFTLKIRNSFRIAFEC